MTESRLTSLVSSCYQPTKSIVGNATTPMPPQMNPIMTTQHGADCSLVLSTTPSVMSTQEAPTRWAVSQPSELPQRNTEPQMVKQQCANHVPVISTVSNGVVRTHTMPATTSVPVTSISYMGQHQTYTTSSQQTVPSVAATLPSSLSLPVSFTQSIPSSSSPSPPPPQPQSVFNIPVQYQNNVCQLVSQNSFVTQQHQQQTVTLSNNNNQVQTISLVPMPQTSLSQSGMNSENGTPTTTQYKTVVMAVPANVMVVVNNTPVTTTNSKIDCSPGSHKLYPLAPAPASTTGTNANQKTPLAPAASEFSRRRNHVCPYQNCNKTYFKSSHLKAHIRTHTGKDELKYWIIISAILIMSQIFKSLLTFQLLKLDLFCFLQLFTD